MLDHANRNRAPLQQGNGEFVRAVLPLVVALLCLLGLVTQLGVSTSAPAAHGALPRPAGHGEPALLASGRKFDLVFGKQELALP